MVKLEVNKNEENSLLLEAHRISYRLRSTFFYRKLNEYRSFNICSSIKELVPINYNYEWSKYKELGISNEAIKVIERSNLKEIEVFAHPRLLREQPHLITYYRNVAALSQKSVSYLTKVNVEKLEKGMIKQLSENTAKSLSCLFNQHISLILETAMEEFNDAHIKGLLFASTGSQIDGSWRNSIGTEAEKVVQKILIKEVIGRNLLTAFINKGNTKEPPVKLFDKHSESTIESNEIKGIMLSNKMSILFSSEPDITILGTDGCTKAVIEIKGGTDPAGALERYGAAKKSFEHSQRLNADVVTILLASCITKEVKERIDSDKTISKYFNLTEIVTSESSKRLLIDYLLGVLNGS